MWNSGNQKMKETGEEQKKESGGTSSAGKRDVACEAAL
jgi:hypothetical protein